MKARMYLDVYPGLNLDTAMAWASPPAKLSGTTRIAFDIDVPDKLITEADIIVDAEVVNTDSKYEPT